MIFWNDKALAEALRENKISKNESDLYLMVFIAELLLPVALYALGWVVANRWAALAVALLAVLGIYLGHHSVRSGDGKDYFIRFSTLAVPVLLRLYLLAAVVYAAVWLTLPKLLTTFWFSILFWSLLVILFFRKINSYLRWVAELKPTFVARQGI